MGISPLTSQKEIGTEYRMSNSVLGFGPTPMACEQVPQNQTYHVQSATSVFTTVQYVKFCGQAKLID